MTPPLVWYFAHPVGAPTPEGIAANLARAKRWLLWLLERCPDAALNAPWLPLVELLDDSIPGNRDRGLRDDVEIARRCDGIILCGGRVSTGMLLELEACMSEGGEVCDLTSLGEEPPPALPDCPIKTGCRLWQQR